MAFVPSSATGSPSAASAVIESSVPMPAGDSCNDLAGDMRMITSTMPVPAVAADLLGLPSMMPSGVASRGRMAGAGAPCISSRSWFHLAFKKPVSSVISRCHACDFALPVAVVIAWQKNFCAQCCGDAGKAKKHARKDLDSFCKPPEHFWRFPGP
jgi:hypothetical protein